MQATCGQPCGGSCGIFSQIGLSRKGEGILALFRFTDFVGPRDGRDRVLPPVGVNETSDGVVPAAGGRHLRDVLGSKIGSKWRAVLASSEP